MRGLGHALIVAACRAFVEDFPGGLAEIATTLRRRQLDVSVHDDVDGKFPDGELCIDLPENADGRPVLICQSLTGGRTEPNAAIMSLLAIARCYRQHGATRTIAVVPHLAYARHDRAIPGERRPVMASLLADLLAASGATDVVTLASGAEAELSRLFGVTGTRLRFIATHGLRLAMLRQLVGCDSIIVAPDRGAYDAARALGSDLGVPVIAAQKRRLGPEAVEVTLARTTGNRHDQHIVIVDDLITSAATVEMTVRAIKSAFRDPRIDVVVTHLRLTPRGSRRLVELRQSGQIRRICATDAAGTLVAVDGLSLTPAVPYLAHALGALLIDQGISPIN